MARTVRGRIEFEKDQAGSLGECRVDLVFERATEELSVEAKARGLGAVQGRVSARTDASGAFELPLPTAIKASGDIRIQVFAPSGQSIADVTLAMEKALEQELHIKVSPFQSISLADGPKPAEPVTRRIRGRVIERNGRPLPTRTQVLLLATRPGEEGSAAELPLFATQIDGSGYFFGDVANRPLQSAVAVVAGATAQVPVALEDGMIPARLIIVVDVPSASTTSTPTDDCGFGGTSSPPRTPSQADIDSDPGMYSADLGTGRCVEFNRPNRAIEEFNFYTVVRTTEPDIRAFGDAGAIALDTTASVAEAQAAVDQARQALADANSAAAAAETTAKSKEAAATVAQQDAARAQASKAAATSALAAAKTALDRAQAEVDRLTTVLAETGAEGPDLAPLKLALVHAKTALARATTARDDAYTVQQSASSYADTLTAAATHATEAAQAARTAASQAAAATSQASEALRSAEDQLARATGAATAVGKPPGRAELTAANSVDWDASPTYYEATTVAHGHLLHFRQAWYADGYSLGDLLYSLPLAPGQMKLVSIVDWERREQSQRGETTTFSESLGAALSRDRDLNEVVSSTLSELARGGSKNTTSGFGVGTGGAGNGSYEGFNFGALLGISGGYGESDSSAWQDSARSLSATSMQNLRDRTLQSASAVRSLRSTVVQTVAQGEAVRATTEAVANHNHCHALTIEYFEVLRHLRVTHELADVQECLFVPLPITPFDLTKTLRWRQSLQTYLTAADLAGAFDAAQRVSTHWSMVDYPMDRYADEALESLSGELQLTLFVPLPPFPDRPTPRPQDTLEQVAQATQQAVAPTTGFLGVLLAVATGGASYVAGTLTSAATQAVSAGARALTDQLYDQPTAQERYDKFQHDVMPGVAVGFVDQLELWALVGTTEVQIPGADFTLVSEYRPDSPLLVSVRATLAARIVRGDIRQLVIKSPNGLPSACRAIVNGATLRYRTTSFEHVLVDDRSVNDDIDLPRMSVSVESGWEVHVEKVLPGSGVTLYTPLDAWEQRRPRKEDERLADALVSHLNDHLEYYHHAIWWTMDPNRRYMLLDGYYAPNSGGRSIASVVENRLIGMVGNSLVLPVARGVHLDPRFSRGVGGTDAEEAPVDLIEYYGLTSPVPPMRVCLPTRGVFAEAVMGACNACEKIDDSRFWRWEESPIDQPPAIGEASTASRRSDTQGTQPSALPAPIVSIQTPPSAPDPTGLVAALNTIGKQSFADITGLAGTQANAATAYSKALDTALAFGKEASTLAQQAASLQSLDRTLSSIDQAEADKKISPEDAQALRLTALKKAVGASTAQDADAGGVQKKLDIIAGAQKANAITPSAAEDLNRGVLHELVSGDNAKNSVDTMMDLARGVDSNSIQKIGVSPDGTVELVSTGYGGGSSGTAPAPKTGLSGLANSQGQTKSRVQAWLDGSKGLLDLFGQALADWKNAPDKSLTDAVVDTLAEAATEAADEITDEVPLLKAMKLATKYSLVFADGIGEGIDQASGVLSAAYARGTDYSDVGNGLTQEDYDAIANVRRWQQNSVAQLDGILLKGASAVVKRAASEFAAWLSSAGTKKLFSLTTDLATHLLNRTPLQGVALEVVNAAADAIPEKRRDLYRAALGGAFGLFVSQLDSASLRQKLKPLADARGAAAFDKAVIKALASCLAEAAVGDPKAKDGSSLLANLNEETHGWLLGYLSQLIAALPSGVTVTQGTDVVEIVGDEVRIPATLLHQIETSDDPSANDTYGRNLAAAVAFAPVKAATEARLTLLSRVRQPSVAQRLADDANDGLAAYNAYWDEVLSICDAARSAYIAAGGDPTVYSGDVIVFDAFQIQQPLKWYLADYELSDPAAGSGSGRIRWMPKPVVAPATL